MDFGRFCTGFLVVMGVGMFALSLPWPWTVRSMEEERSGGSVESRLDEAGGERLQIGL